MIHFDDLSNFPKMPARQPDFNNILSILKKEKPRENTLFEFFLNRQLEQRLSGIEKEPSTFEEDVICKIKAFQNAGYDYVTIHSSEFSFKHSDNNHGEKSISVNEGSIIQDEESYLAYKWENPKDYDKGQIEQFQKHLPEGMKFIVYGPGGVLENVMALTGYDNLCYMLAEDEALLEEIFMQVGTRLLEYYRTVLDYESVGAIISNDDWGFNTQTMLAPDDMRKYVFKWHRKITDLVHKAGKPVILHSCGQLEKVYDDIIFDMKYDGKHSYEDNILPVEDAYEMLQGRLAVLGGMDLDFVCRAAPKDVYARSCKMLERSGSGGYALGTGNSVPDYVPHDNYFAMIAAVNYNR